MTLLIAAILIYQFDMLWQWYLVAGVIWVIEWTIIIVGLNELDKGR